MVYLINEEPCNDVRVFRKSRRRVHLARQPHIQQQRISHDAMTAAVLLCRALLPTTAASLHCCCCVVCTSQLVESRIDKTFHMDGAGP